MKENVILNQLGFKILIYRVTHKAWDFRDDCTELMLSVSLDSHFPSWNCLLVSFFGKSLNMQLKEFQVVFAVLFFVYQIIEHKPFLILSFLLTENWVLVVLSFISFSYEIDKK